MKRYQNRHILRALAWLPFIAVFSFSGLDLGQDNRLLFQLKSRRSGMEEDYDTLVLSDLDENSRQLLSFYPERVYYTSGSDSYLLQNRFGLYSGNIQERSLSHLDFYPSFRDSQFLKLGRLDPMALSPDGQYIVFFEQNSLVRGDLVLYDMERNKKVIITEDFEPDYAKELVKWSPDSRFFCYSKNGNIYYYSISQYMEGRTILESAHIIGKGSIHSFNWSQDNSLYYIDGRNIYRVHSTEIFALSFYETPLQIGTVAGRLFLDFDRNRDRFWLSPSGETLLIRKGEGNVFLYGLEFRDYNLNSQVQSLPFIKMPVGAVVQDVLWSKSGKIVILTENKLKQAGANLIFLYDPDRNSESILAMNQTGVKNIRLSPDEKYVSLVHSDHISIRSLQEWDLIKQERIEGILDHHWINDEKILYFSNSITGIWNYSRNEDTMISLSQVDRYGFNTNGNIQMTLGDDYYLWNEDLRRWDKSSENYFRESRSDSPSYRVFKERIKSIYYDEMIMVRKIEGYGTYPLIESEETEWESYPEEEAETGSLPGYFIHGSRIRRREIAFVFNITSEDDGMLEVLNILSDYGINATFFVNGDFIRKYPGALRILQQEGHELGSMFFTFMDMSNRQYNIDEDFIIRGLARNEDDFYKATGGEVATLWHAPWYFVNTMIIEAGREINYTYVSRDIDSLDWVGVDDKELYADSSELINRIMELKQPGSIVSMTIGVEEERKDYLYQKLELLINALWKQGYDIVDVTTLMNNAR